MKPPLLSQVAVAHCTIDEPKSPTSGSAHDSTSAAAAASPTAAPPAGAASGAGPSSAAAPQALSAGTLARDSSLGAQWHLAWMTGTMHPGTLARMRELMILQEAGGSSSVRRRPASESVPFYQADVPQNDGGGARI